MVMDFWYERWCGRKESNLHSGIQYVAYYPRLCAGTFDAVVTAAYTYSASVHKIKLI